MHRQFSYWMALSSLVALMVAAPAMAQQGGNAGGTTAGTGGRAAGSASTLSASQGYGLDTRFMGSGFDVYTQGSAGLGSTTAGARAGSAGFGQTTTGTFGNPQGGTGQFGLGNFGGINAFGGLGGLGAYGLSRNMFRGQNSMQTTQTTGKIRTRTKLGFTQPLPPSSAVSANFNGVISRVLARGDYGKGSVNIVMEGQVAVLQGTVESDHARDVAERLALLEPGISEVRNELTVRAAEPTRETSTTESAAGSRQ